MLTMRRCLCIWTNYDRFKRNKQLDETNYDEIEWIFKDNEYVWNIQDIIKVCILDVTATI